jgi:hypothetical protein
MENKTKKKCADRVSLRKYNSGQAMLISVMFFVLISAGVAGGITAPILTEISVAHTMSKSKKTFMVAEAGVEDVTLRIKKKKSIVGVQTVVIGSDNASVTVTDIDEDNKKIFTTATVDNTTRAINADLTKVIEVNFLYGAQVGDGGIRLENSSSILGNVYSNGPIVGQSNNVLSGTVISAGPDGNIEKVHVGIDAHAHTIKDATVDNDAYYQSLISSTVWGVTYPDSSDELPLEMPIDDSIIDELKQSATSTIISSPCPYIINSDKTIGPAKIECDLKIKGNPTVTLGGNLWIEGNLETENIVTLAVTPEFGDKSVAIIVDNPANQLTSSKIELQNSVVFEGSGATSSYIMLLSQNKSAEEGGGEKAIKVSNSVSGEFLLYAGHGEVSLENSVNLKEVSGYRVRLQNTAQVVYEDGLESVLFPVGPSGVWKKNGWGEQ